MKLGTKLLIVIVSTSILIGGVAYFGSVYILSRSYISLENKQILADFNLLNNAIKSLTDSNVKTVTNWSNWDDMYNYALETDPAKKKKFIDLNFQPPTLAASAVDVALIFNAKGEELFETMLNSDRTKAVAFPAEIHNLFTPNGELGKIVSPPTNAQGLIDTKKGIIVLAAQQILTTNGKGPIHGTQILGTFLTDDIWNKVKADSKLDMTFYPLSSIKNNNELSKIYPELLTQPNQVRNLNDNTLFLYSLMNDINGKPMGIVKVIATRNIHLLGLKTIHYFNIAFLVISIISFLLLIYLLRLLVVNRLIKIDNEILKIDSKKDFSRRVPEKGSDELSLVAKEINNMLSTIEDVESLLSDIVNSMPSLIVIVDKDFKIRTLNNLAEQAINLPSEKAKGKLLFDLFPYLNEYKNKFDTFMNDNTIQKINNIQYTINNEMHTFNVLIYPFLRTGEKQLAIRIDDISEYIKLEKQLEQSDKLAAIGMITSGVAYEIDIPVKSILSTISPVEKNINDALTLLEKYSSLKPDDYNIHKLEDITQLEKSADISQNFEKTKTFSDHIKNDAKKIADIVKNLKKFARLDEDVMKKANVQEGIDAILNLLQHQYKNKITIIKDYGASEEIDCFPGRINQVFMNVITNAIDAIPQQGEIKITTRKEGGSIKISIKDNGIGMDKETQVKIFDPFFTTKGGENHTGVGLSIASSIVHDHRGNIEIKSETGKGTEVIITLPIKTSTDYKEGNLFATETDSTRDSSSNE